MNHKYTTIAIAAFVASIAVTAVGFAVPQQAMAHYGHQNHNQRSSINVNQDIGQANVCSNSTCVNDASNDAQIHGH